MQRFVSNTKETGLTGSNQHAELGARCQVHVNSPVMTSARLRCINSCSDRVWKTAMQYGACFESVSHRAACERGNTQHWGYVAVGLGRPANVRHADLCHSGCYYGDSCMKF